MPESKRAPERLDRSKLEQAVLGLRENNPDAHAPVHDDLDERDKRQELADVSKEESEIVERIVAGEATHGDMRRYDEIKIIKRSLDVELEPDKEQ